MTTDSGDATPGRPVVQDLPADATAQDLEDDGRYLATVNGVVDYGVFVDLSDAVSGLVHESALEDEYGVGDELVVELEEIRENGDLAFQPVSLPTYDVTSPEPSPTEDVSASTDLPDALGESATVEGEIVKVNQTGGPTVFHVRDPDGVVPCAAFEAAGIRAYPEVGLGDLVAATGTVERREGTVQIEVDALETLPEDRATALEERLAAAVEERATPADVDPLVEWPAFEPIRADLRDVADLLRRTVLESRPIRIRHHADGDGMCGAVPVQYALETFIAEVHADPDAPRHLVKRLPSKAPYYEMEDATRDLTFALEDRDKHGQKLPLLLMLDNGSTAEDVPAYETLRHYDIPIVVVDHHHPDPEAVEDLLTAHVNPYLHGEDYRITTGMCCVELARMIAPSIDDELRHLPAIAGIADRSTAEAMDDYLALAAAQGYEEADLADVSEALDYAAHWLRYDAAREFVTDLLNVDCEDESRHRDLVAFLAERSREDVDEQLSAALPHLESERLDNGARLYRVDVENHAHRFTYPAPGKTTGEIHDRKVRETGDPVITIGYGPDFAVLRSDGVRLDIPTMVSDLQAEVAGGGVSGGGHLVVGSIKYVPGRREEVLETLVEKMEDAELDEEVTIAGPVRD